MIIEPEGVPLTQHQYNRLVQSCPHWYGWLNRNCYISDPFQGMSVTEMLKGL